MNVLISDDSVVIRTVYKNLLTPYGATFVEAQTGEEAVAAFEYAFNNEKFNLILMDYQMPGMNGLEAMVKIRAIEKNSVNPPEHVCAIMLTTMEDPMLLVDAYNKGKCNGYIIKSDDPSELLERLKKYNLIS